MKCFMTPAIAKLTAKKIHRSHATLSICHIGCSPLEKFHCTQTIIIALSRKANAHSKKSLASMLIRYVLSTVIAFAFHFTGGLKREVA